eukprot:3089567-Prymnesium_polylepis.1
MPGVHNTLMWELGSRYAMRPMVGRDLAVAERCLRMSTSPVLDISHGACAGVIHVRALWALGELSGGHSTKRAELRGTA